MKTISIILSLLLSTALSVNHLRAQSGPPWVKTNVGYNYILRGVDFPSNQDNIGYISGESLTYQGNGIVLKTTDGGSTWTPVWTGAGEGAEGSCFVDTDNGFVAGWPKLSAGWSGFGKTTDGGATWTSPPVTPDVYYYTDVVFKDASNGILLGSTNTLPGVWVTSNGGTSWTIATGLASVPNHACHVSGNTYFLVDNAGHIQKSVNNGASWSTVYSVPGGLLTGIKFYNNLTGMACGDNGVIVKTYDGGTTWTVQTVGTDIWHDFGWDTPTHVYVCGTPELVYESTNNGATWTNAFPGSAYQAALYECIFTAGGWGYICGSQGTLLKRVPSCSANFSASATSACTGKPVTFTSLATGSNLSYRWTFTGGTPPASVSPNPVVVYNTPGSYNVKLVVNNGYWADSLLQVNYITASQSPPSPVISAAGFTLTSSIPNGNQWYLNGIMIAGATGPSHTAVHSGWYWDVVTANGCSSDTSNNIDLVMTGVDENHGPVVHVAPVPCDGLFTVDFDWAGGTVCSMTVCNSMGVAIYRDSFTMHNGRAVRKIDLRSSPAGLYILEMIYESGRTVRKVLIRK